MFDKRQNPYLPNSFLLNTCLVGGFLACAMSLGAFIFALCGRPFFKVAHLGAQGDFFGGHLSAIFGGLALFFVISQMKQQADFFQRQMEELQQQSEEQKKLAQRQYFLDGINLISTWDAKDAGCEQAMRILDYYSDIAIKAKDEELLLALNMVITGTWLLLAKLEKTYVERTDHTNRKITLMLRLPSL